MNKKNKILIIVGNYLPGFKSGGILRSVLNTIDHLSEKFEFFVVTRNHDLGLTKPYENVKVNEWQKLGNTQVYYLDHKSSSFKSICNLINSNSYDCIHLNSFFDELSIKVNFAMKIGKIKMHPLVISPRGEFAEASFRIKHIKKYLFVRLVKIFRIYSIPLWQVSSELEMKDLERIMGISKRYIKIAEDLPTHGSRFNHKHTKVALNEKQLKIIFLSRISREKNLETAIEILNKVDSNIQFDIYGNIESKTYWKKCKKMIDLLPKNIEVKYSGVVEPSEVLNVFSKYDLFLFPTGGENFGHVIAESLLAGTKVLISKNTPWLNLEHDQLGWDIDLTDLDSFALKIHKMSLKKLSIRLEDRKNVKRLVQKRLSSPIPFDNNRQLYTNLIEDFK
jgi:glycosyltransferase involved in cell wall biosynthesis